MWHDDAMFILRLEILLESIGYIRVYVYVYIYIFDVNSFFYILRCNCFPFNVIVIWNTMQIKNYHALKKIILCNEIWETKRVHNDLQSQKIISQELHVRLELSLLLLNRSKT